ncbi:hypothetical protein CAPTEDRAFT_209790 [Capitella teleta]|uniref:Inward rectifier potassium channel C-terminal domain-containing protein n=1 Tax=Capitella teleta TaxID=283909 RepID=R7T9B5_CAPTE|nr:hypothetical protein CAPTEDRAFT_209790 [Capitella teleta]|eukprot:ELT87589.1 hypothetical protein CAPTEDRAFT_209790 [Capitella teleta]
MTHKTGRERSLHLRREKMNAGFDNINEDDAEMETSTADALLTPSTDTNNNLQPTKSGWTESVFSLPRQMSFTVPHEEEPLMDSNYQKKCTDEAGLPVYQGRRSLIQKALHLDRSNKRRSKTAYNHQARLMSKDGEPMISNIRIRQKNAKYLEDIFTTLLDMRWRYCLLIFALAFLLSWLFFATIYYVICIVHEDHLHVDDPDWKPCHCNVYDFTTAFLFSLETQHTIGYGFRGMEPNCIPSMITLAAQSCCGAFFQCIVTGLVFAKLSRPKRRAETIMFSRQAVISQSGHHRYLLFRVGDMRKTHICGTSIRAILIRNEMTCNGDVIPICQYALPLQIESMASGDNFLWLQWPVIVSHHIDRDSALWDVSADDLKNEYLEVIVILEGTVASTGMFTQVRTSYVASEILWLHRLVPLLTYRVDSNGYKIDHSKFHETISQDLKSESSAKELHTNHIQKTKMEEE